MNDDLFSAHFLLRKMQEDEWGMSDRSASVN